MLGNTVQYTICQGDTLQGIAQRFLGDASRAMDIAAYNNLAYPFISEGTLVEGVKKTGDTIIIPLDTVATGEQEDTGSNLVDLVLTSGEVSLNVYGDLQVVSGTSAIEQSISHRLSTPKGTLLYHPEYGSDLEFIIGNKRDTYWKQRAIIEIERAIRCDPNVVDVSDITLSDIPGGIHLKCSVKIPQDVWIQVQYSKGGVS